MGPVFFDKRKKAKIILRNGIILYFGASVVFLYIVLQYVVLCFKQARIFGWFQKCYYAFMKTILKKAIS